MASLTAEQQVSVPLLRASWLNIAFLHWRVSPQRLQALLPPELTVDEGYGDHYPVTTTGRFVAGGLMMAGIALIGVVTATFASWLIDRVAEVEAESQAATRHDVEGLRAELAALREELRQRARNEDGPPPVLETAQRRTFGRCGRASPAASPGPSATR